MKNQRKVAPSELVEKIKQYGKLCQKIGSEKADYYRGHSDVDPALEAECKKKFDEILKLLY